ncbi:hypothetical protein K488DRAFT_89410 [Vararia minispora EC-137]|uniref:Uncharacterized protein n=1 Tax=Vararia minispora EC-137 TaxID=1314806 RepID=A0ACB8QAK1_9AGAM|nr:hypothetical protein K488DRAFT_89410 [Vararia minispora EC-137]
MSETANTAGTTQNFKTGERGTYVLPLLGVIAVESVTCDAQYNLSAWVEPGSLWPRPSLLSLTVKEPDKDKPRPDQRKLKTEEYTWTFDPPRGIPPGATVKVRWNASSAKLPSSWTRHKMVIKVSHTDLSAFLVAHNTDRYEREKKPIGKMTLITEADETPTPDLQAEAAQLEAQQLLARERERERERELAAAKRKRILDRLGGANVILKIAKNIVHAVRDIHPIVEYVAFALEAIYNALRSGEDDNDRLWDLITLMADAVHYIFAVEKFVKLDQLRTVLEDFRKLIERTSKFVDGRKMRTNGGVVWSRVTHADERVIGKLAEDYRTLIEKYKLAISAENFLSVEAIRTQLTEFISSQEDVQCLEKLKPQSFKGQRCLEGTRAHILADIHSWADDYSRPGILWIRARPGAGKSTIASHVADEFRTSGRLGVFFAFTREHDKDIVSLWTTLAYYLSFEYPKCKNEVVHAIKGHALENATPEDIFQKLIVRSLEALRDKIEESTSPVPPPVIVIDALDLCGNPGNSHRMILLNHLQEWSNLSEKFPGLKLIVTSRHEPYIPTKFIESVPHHPLEIPSGEKDIRLYLSNKFEEIRQMYAHLNEWPGPDSIDKLAIRACSSFFWATTAMDYIGHTDHVQRLQSLLKPEAGLDPGEIDLLYHHILASPALQVGDREEKYFRGLYQKHKGKQFST